MREAGLRVDAAEAHEWLAYRRLEPDDRTYLRAILEALCCVCTSLGNKRASADFLPVLKRAARVEQSSKQGIALWLSVFPYSQIVKRDP